MTISTDRLRGVLVPASLAYLALPVLIFLVGWLRPVLGAAMAVLLLAGVAAAIRDSRTSERELRESAPRPSRAIPVAGLAAAFALLSVFIAVGFLAVVANYNGDWLRRFEILLDVARQDWPVVYQTETGPAALVYYIAWFLPVAPVVATFGWHAGLAALLTWITLGFGLAGAWLVLVVRAHPLLAMAVFLSYSSINIWENLVQDGVRNTLQEIFEGDFFQWQPHFGFMPGYKHFIDSNHGIPAWILAGLTLDAADGRTGRYPVALILALALLWSPFVAVGLLPLAVVPVLTARGTLRERISSQLGMANLAGAGVGLVMVLYFASRWFPYSFPAVYGPDVPPQPDGFFPTLPGIETLPFLKTWAIYCTIAFLGMTVPLLIAFRPWAEAGPRLAMLWAASGFLLVITLFRYGHFNDLSFRATNSALFVLVFLSIDLLARFRRHPAAATLLAGFLFLGALSALAQMVRAVHRIERDLDAGKLMVSQPPGDLFTQQLWLRERGLAIDRLPQYLGSTDSPFFRLLAAPSEARVIPPAVLPEVRSGGPRRGKRRRAPESGP